MTLSLLTGVDIILHVVHLGFPLVHLVHDLDMACFGAWDNHPEPSQGFQGWQQSVPSGSEATRHDKKCICNEDEEKAIPRLSVQTWFTYFNWIWRKQNMFSLYELFTFSLMWNMLILRNAGVLNGTYERWLVCSKVVHAIQRRDWNFKLLYAVIIFVQRYNMDQYGTMINPGIKWVDHLFSQLKHFKGSSYGPSKWCFPPLTREFQTVGLGRALVVDNLPRWIRPVWLDEIWEIWEVAMLEDLDG